MTLLIESAVKLVLDVVVLVAMGVIAGRKHHPRYLKLLAGSLAVAAAFTVYDWLPRFLLGYLFGVLLVAGAAVVLALYGRLKWKHAAIGALVFFTIHAAAGWFI